MRVIHELPIARFEGQRTAVVMTMGALHEGHATLLREARKSADVVIATIFVNPLQFGANEDLDRYPRTLDSDLEVCRAEGVDIVFAPSAKVMYPTGTPQVTVHPGPLGDVLEGAVRPGHFAGVLTVVLKLLNMTHADVAYFGEKDYQQLTLIRQMVTDLSVPVEVVGVPTVRESDGLALSSRNRYLSAEERQAALAISRALFQAAGSNEPLATAEKELGGLNVDYCVLRDPMLGEYSGRGPGRMLIAARVGTTRLIDNIPLELPR